MDSFLPRHGAFPLQTKEVLEAMRDDYQAGEVGVLKADGGASQNNLLLQIQADHLQVCPSASEKDWDGAVVSSPVCLQLPLPPADFSSLDLMSR